jgi:hypothetical protein
MHFRMTSCERSRRAPVCPLSTHSSHPTLQL